MFGGFIMRIGIIMGGPSSERDISIYTGNEMVKYINTEIYDIKTILIHSPDDLEPHLNEIDFALLALHGEFGEDGTIQKILEDKGIPYSGSGIKTSALCMDKDQSKSLMLSEGLHTPQWLTFHAPVSLTDSLLDALISDIGLPFIVKPNRTGSSLGMTLVHRKDEIADAFNLAFQYDSMLLVESYVKGLEITCSVLDDELLPIIEILPPNEVFDFQGKYEDVGVIKRPCTLTPALYKKVQEDVLKAYRIHNCTVYARIDIILQDDIPYLLEINTLPGLTKSSFFPRSANLSGYTFPHLLDRLIALSLIAQKT